MLTKIGLYVVWAFATAEGPVLLAPSPLLWKQQ